MRTTRSSEQKQAVLNRYFSGESVGVIVADTGTPRSTVYAWVKTENEKREKKRGRVSIKAYNQLQEHVKRLEGMLEILQSCRCAPTAPLPEKLEVLEELYFQDRYSVRLICEALKVPRGTFYNHIFRNKRSESSYEKRKEDLRIRVLQVYDDSNQIFGAPKIAAVLANKGVKVSKEMVRQLMLEMGLGSIRTGAKKQYVDELRKTRNIVNRNFQVDKPNQVWVSDVTYFCLNGMKFYICTIMDLYARKIISYRIGSSNSTHLVKTTFQNAYESRQPEEGLIFHSDQGSNYRSRVFRSFLQKRGVTQSFSKPGVPYDNSVMETFFSTLKREELYRYRYRSEKEFRASVERYIHFYNHDRPHKTLLYKTPEEKEQIYWDSRGNQAEE